MERARGWRAGELEQHMDDPDAMGLYGSLCLHLGISAAYQGDDGNAWRFWDTADRMASALPAGYFHPQTIFGQANVDIHGVSIAAELRRFGEAVGRAERIDPELVPSRERRGRLYGEIAAGHMQRRELDRARHFLEFLWPALACALVFTSSLMLSRPRPVRLGACS